MTEIKIEFHIIGERFPPDEITKMLNINPTEAYCKGDIFMGGPEKENPMKRKECCWSLETEYIESIDLPSELRKVYEVLKDKVEVLKEIQRKFSATCKFVIVLNLADNPIILLERDIIKFAGEIDAEFDFDTYI